MIKVRFAPSPSGLLHLGNISTALWNWLYVKKHGGDFILRLDDTQWNPESELYLQYIKRDLSWLNINWNVFFRQSDCLSSYKAAFDFLKSEGRVYPCYETPEELDTKKKMQIKLGKPPMYDRSSLSLLDADRKKLEEEGVRPYWRFLLLPKVVTWDDLCLGNISYDTSNVSDPVIIRADGTWLYNFSSVVNDRDMEISHVWRGKDHISNTAIQIQMFEALNSSPPIFGHTLLIVGDDGKPLGKRLQSFSVDNLRSRGIMPLSILNWLCVTSGVIKKSMFSFDDIIQSYDYRNMRKKNMTLNDNDLLKANHRLLATTDFCVVKNDLFAMGLADNKKAKLFWQVVQNNINSLDDCRQWINIVQSNINPIIVNKPLLNKILELLPDNFSDINSCAEWLRKLPQLVDMQGYKLYHPLRLAITGCESGPELSGLLFLVPIAVIKSRLRGTRLGV